jgi:hypothetical protein
VFGVKPCDMIMARCSRYVVRSASGLLIWTGPQVSNWVTGGAGAKLNVRSPNRDEFRTDVRRGWRLWSLIITAVSLTAFGFGWLGIPASYWQPHSQREEPTAAAAIHAVVDQIISVESDGNPNAKNRRSSATGLGQFLDETWLEMIRAHRPDLAKGRSQAEILELRRDAKIAREITARFTERNAETLRKRGLPVTPGTLYLAHFAGGAGAVAILSAMANADAARRRSTPRGWPRSIPATVPAGQKCAMGFAVRAAPKAQSRRSGAPPRARARLTACGRRRESDNAARRDGRDARQGPFRELRRPATRNLARGGLQKRMALTCITPQ